MFNALITGGSGTLGKALTRELFKSSAVGKVACYSRDEFKQSEIEKEFGSDGRWRGLIGDVRDEDRLEYATRDIDIVFHAAAMKQVPACEYNPTECFDTNIGGARNVINACIQNSVDRCIALSTDKACDPINVYGTSKAASDKLFVAANNIVGKNRTRFAVVRYGNVVGSRGSVVPFFQSLPEGINTPITDPTMTRFWLTLPNAVDFVTRSLKRMQGGEIFVPRIPSVHITDIAKAIRPSADMDIIGSRPGEKKHEAMISEHDSIVEFDDHFVIPPSIRFNDLHISYERNALGEEGEFRDNDCAYTSDENEFLTVEQIRSMI